MGFGGLTLRAAFQYNSTASAMRWAWVASAFPYNSTIARCLSPISCPCSPDLGLCPRWSARVFPSASFGAVMELGLCSDGCLLRLGRGRR